MDVPEQTASRRLKLIQFSRSAPVVFTVLALVCLGWLVIAALSQPGPQDFRYAALYILVAAMPTIVLQSMVVASHAFQRWRSGWFREQRELEALMAAADARGDDPDAVYDQYMLDKHGIEPQAPAPPQASRQLTDDEIKAIETDVNYKMLTQYGRSGTYTAARMFTIAAEEAIFFAPIVYFGLPWWAVIISAVLWGAAHWPTHSLIGSAYIAVIGCVSGFFILPHGILVNALGHFLNDYLVCASARRYQSTMGRMGYDP